ncbi:MAG: 3-phosphoshikimate 1-carboxyvinyltransferase [Lentisphaeria bacterium]
MKFSVKPSTLKGDVFVPGSKSHTIRAVLVASLADGRSELEKPLASSDTEAAVNVYSAFGVKFDRSNSEKWIVDGIGSNLSSISLPEGTVLDTLNSGTTMRVAVGTCTLFSDGHKVTLTGDEQIQRRPIGPLAEALTALGGKATPVGGCPPIEVCGGLKGGEITIECKTSQYLSSLLLCCPLAKGDSTIHVPLLNEKPYVQMTMDWLKRQNIEFTANEELSEFYIKGGQKFKPFSGPIPADWSTAGFFLVAGCLGENGITLEGLDVNDAQGDKAVLDYLREMGATIVMNADGSIHISAKQLNGIDIDMNATPDALPIMSVAACFAKGTTRLLNVPQARIKETDRIAVMAQELTKMGAKIEELEDGMVIEGTTLHAADVEGHHDHRVVMSLAIAGMAVADGVTTVTTAEAAAVTVPEFQKIMERLGGSIEAI